MDLASHFFLSSLGNERHLLVSEHSKMGETWLLLLKHFQGCWRFSLSRCWVNEVHRYFHPKTLIGSRIGSFSPKNRIATDCAIPTSNAEFRSSSGKTETVAKRTPFRCRFSNILFSFRFSSSRRAWILRTHWIIIRSTCFVDWSPIYTASSSGKNVTRGTGTIDQLTYFFYFVAYFALIQQIDG